MQNFRLFPPLSFHSKFLFIVSFRLFYLFLLISKGVGSNQKLFVHCITQLFQLTEKDISLSHFSKMIKWFGPMYGTENLLNRIVYIMKQRWFYGTKSALEAEVYPFFSFYSSLSLIFVFLIFH